MKQRPLMSHGSLFAGIGGFDLGFEWAGIKTVWQVEIDAFRRAVLASVFPHAQRFDNIKSCGLHNLKRVDIISAGWPCQPFSYAGKRLGKEDPRYLWPEVRRVVEALLPRWFVGENVPAIVRSVLDQVLFDLEDLGYTTLPIIIPLCAFGAWHQRERAITLAYLDGGSRGPMSPQQQKGWPKVSHRSSAAPSHPQGARLANRGRAEKPARPIQKGTDLALARRERCLRTQWTSEPEVGRMVHGIPHRMDRISALGDSFAPIEAYWIADRIIEFERLISKP